MTYPAINGQRPWVPRGGGLAASWFVEARQTFLRAASVLLPLGRSVPILSGPLRGWWWHVAERRHRSYFAGRYEPSVQAALTRFLRPGIAVCDVGAHAGFHTLLAAKLVGPRRVVRAAPGQR